LGFIKTKNLKIMEKMELLKIGTKVFDIRFGWGEIVDNNYGRYAYRVRYNVDRYATYAFSGKSDEIDFNPMLSLTEYDLVNGGFTPLSDYNKPRKFDVGYFWDNEDDHEITYSQLIDIRKDKFINSGFAEWTHFSKEVPEWFTKRIKNKN
jgi:hypothetical protein